MLIRCERCSTMYELDEGVLSPEGSEVQCARCQHVFTVRPPQAPGLTLQGVPAQEPPARPAPTPPPAAAGPGPELPPGPPAGQAISQFHRPAVYRPTPSQPSQPTVTRPPVIRRDTVGTFESRLRWSHRWKWLAPALLVGVVAAGAAVLLLRETSAERGARRAHAHALSLALADDVQSLEQARAELDRALAASPRLHAARADRALVDLLLAGVLAEAPAEKGELRARHERSKALVLSAGAALDELGKASLARAEVARARAVAGTFGAGRTELRGLTTAALAALPGDPWASSAEAAVDVRSSDRAARDRALAELAAVVVRRPDALRARYLLARGQALAGRNAEALVTVAKLLEQNPRHEGALALRDAVARPPPGAPIAQPAAVAPEKAGAEEKATTAPRKPDSTAGEGGDAPRVEAAARPPAGKPAPPAPEAPGEVAPPAGDAPAAGGAEAAPPAEPPPPPRLRPAAVPEPEPVRDGG